MAQETRAHDGCVVVFPENREDDKDGQENQHHYLCHNDQQHRSDEVQKLIQVQAHEGHGEVQIQHYIADAVHQREAEVIPVELLIQVADDNRHEHGAHVGGEAHADELADPAGDLGAQGHADQKGRHVLHHIEGGELLAVSLIDLLHGGIQGLAVVRGQMILLNQHPGHRAADENAEDQAEGCRSRTDGDAGGIAHLHKGRAVGAGRAVSADHGDGAGEQRIGVLKTGHGGKSDTDTVLDDGYDACNQPVDDQ